MTTEQIELVKRMGPESAECTLRYLLAVGPVDVVAFDYLSSAILKKEYGEELQELSADDVLEILNERLNLNIVENEDGNYCLI